MSITETCRCCRTPVRYRLTIGGKRIAVDPAPHPDGTVVLEPDLRARILTGDQLPAQTVAYREHRCGQVARPRLCRACHKPIDPAAGALHPGCEPAPRPEPAAQLEAAPSHEQEELPL